VAHGTPLRCERLILRWRRSCGEKTGISLLTWLPFNFVLRRGEQEMGTYKRVLGKFRDRYVLELAPQMRDADRRLIVAFAVGLDALQDR
jgi:hypothetical protein